MLNQKNINIIKAVGTISAIGVVTAVVRHALKKKETKDFTLEDLNLDLNDLLTKENAKLSEKFNSLLHEAAPVQPQGQDFFDVLVAEVIENCTESDEVLKAKVTAIIDRFDNDPDSFTAPLEEVAALDMDTVITEDMGFYEKVIEAMTGVGTDSKLLRQRLRMYADL